MLEAFALVTELETGGKWDADEDELDGVSVDEAAVLDEISD